MKRGLLLLVLLLVAGCAGRAEAPPPPTGVAGGPALAPVTETPVGDENRPVVQPSPATITPPPPLPPPTNTPPPAGATQSPPPPPAPSPSPPPVDLTVAPPVLPPPPAAGVATFTYRVVNRYPHDPEAFTQGLVFVDGTLYEGTGLRGESSLRRVDLTSGAVLQQVFLDDAYFGEGIVVWGERIIQLTWQSNVALVYERESFEQVGTFTYPTEGWGLTHDGERLLMSDGTSRITFRDPLTFAALGHVDVHDENGPVVRLNELEYIEGSLLANVWQTDTIVRIDPQTGRVTGRIDLSGLLSPAERAAADVLNGIAFDAATGRLFVTGKWWPWLFEIDLVPADD